MVQMNLKVTKSDQNAFCLAREYKRRSNVASLSWLRRLGYCSQSVADFRRDSLVTLTVCTECLDIELYVTSYSKTLRFTVEYFFLNRYLNSIYSIIDYLRGKISIYYPLPYKLPSNMCNIFNYVSGSHQYISRTGSQGNLVQISCKNKSDERKFMSRGGGFLLIICLSRPSNHFLLVFLFLNRM